jgi:hypothetical protein
MIYKINNFCTFSILFVFSHVCLFFTILMWMGLKWCILTYKKYVCGRGLKRHALEFILVFNFGWSKQSIWGDQLWNPIINKHWFWVKKIFTRFNTLYTTIFMFTNLDFIHTRICYGSLNESNHQEYSVLFVAVLGVPIAPIWGPNSTCWGLTCWGPQ